MSAGFSFLSDYGTSLIDQDYSMLEFRGKYTLALTPDGVVTTPGYVGEVLAIGASDYPVALVGKSGNTWSFRTASMSVADQPSQTVTVYLFALPDQVSPVGTAGLMVYRADGAVAYNSLKRYMRVVDVATGSNSTLSVSAVAGDYAALVCGSPASGLFVQYRYEDSVYFREIYQLAPSVKASVSGAALSMGIGRLIGSRPGWSGSAGPIIRASGGASLVLIDVSDL